MAKSVQDISATPLVPGALPPRSMGRNPFPGNFEVEFEGPLDTRTVVTSIAELLSQSTQDGTTVYQYFGMLVTVSGDLDANGAASGNDGVYRLLENYGGNADSSVIGAWEKLGSGSNNGDDIFVTGGTVTVSPGSSLLTLTLNDGNTLPPIDFTECCGGGIEQFYESAFEIPTVKTVGGIDNGTDIADLTGKTFSEIFDLMFFPTQTPAHTSFGPGLTLRDENGSLIGTMYEVGTELNITFDTTASGGGWNPSSYAGGVTQPSNYTGPLLSGVINQIVGGDTTVDGTDYKTPGTDFEIDNPEDAGYIVIPNKNKWELVTQFDVGLEPFDSTGQIIVNGNFNDSDTFEAADEFIGTYPVYVRHVDDSTNTDAGMLKLTTSGGQFNQPKWSSFAKGGNNLKHSLNETTLEFTIDFKGSNIGLHGQVFEFMIPQDMGRINVIKQANTLDKYDGQPYQTIDQSGTNNGSGGEIWVETSTTKNVNGNATGVAYWHYVLNPIQPLQGASRFKIGLNTTDPF